MASEITSGEEPLSGRKKHTDSESEQFLLSSTSGNIRPSAAFLKTIEQSGDDWSANTSSVSDEEDYDSLQPDPKTVVAGSTGGGFETSTTNGASTPVVSIAENGKTHEPITPNPKTRVPIGPRKRSIQVTLEQTNKRGKYILTADDPAFKEIMHAAIKRGIQTQDEKKPRIGDMVFTRRFTTFDRQNPLSAESPFHGFFTLFWLCIGMLLVRVAAQNYRNYGSVLGEAQLLHMMFDRDIVVLGITDGVMCAATSFGILLQKIIAKGYLSWKKYGWIIQNIWQTFYLFAVLAWTWYRDWPWQHTIFTVLHSFVFLMKQHSYAFYNGYLSQVSRRRRILETKLQQLQEIEPIAGSPISPHVALQATATESPERGHATRRGRRSSQPATMASTNLRTEQSEVSSIVAAIDSGLPLDDEQLDAFSNFLRSEIAALTTELTGKSTAGSNTYPDNLTVANWADYICLPTLVYELEYPRQESRNWLYIAEKSAATLGCIWVMMVVSQAYIYPPVMETVRMKENGMTLQERWREFPWILGDLLFPMLLEQLMTWYVIWECILNVLAELTLFADRGFYGDWWNSVSWDQYARDWNRPVHNFLLRHVYHSSISTFRLSKTGAMFATFLLSALVHELVMLCLFKKVRGYLFLMQLSQIPLAAMSKTRFMKGRHALGNVVFWFGLFVGPSLITSLYLIV